ncbi:hypothetical protein ECE46_02535 [Helicobacter pylori]|nr:hypothetical protein ECE46_02535 [Helicobacter pylori]
MNKAFIFDKKNLYSIKIRLKSNQKGVFITLYRILQAYSDKIFCWFSLLKNTLSLFAFHSIFV